MRVITTYYAMNENTCLLPTIALAIAEKQLVKKKIYTINIGKIQLNNNLLTQTKMY